MDNKSTLQSLAAIATILALIVAVIGLFIANNHSNSSSASASTTQPTSPSSATHVPMDISTPTSAGSLASVPSPTAIPTSRPITPGTELCGADSSHGWSGWSLGSSWHTVGGALVNDGTNNSGTFAPDLIPPDSCQGRTADIAIKANIKVDALGYGGFGLNVRGQSTPDGWAGYALWMYIACYDASNSSCIQPVVDAVDHDPESTELSRGQYAVGSAFHTYEFDVHGNSITIKVDGATILSTTDNRFLNSGQIGIFCKDGTQVEVRSVHVVAL